MPFIGLTVWKVRYFIYHNKTHFYYGVILVGWFGNSYITYLLALNLKQDANTTNYYKYSIKRTYLYWKGLIDTIYDNKS